MINETLRRICMKYERQSILNDLKMNIMEVTFTKADGTRRVMHCTLMPEYLPKGSDLQHLEEEHAKRENKDVVVCWDLKEHGWRSFRVDRVDYVQEVPNG
jgi:WYL domain-containing protein